MREFIETLELSVGVCLRSSKDVTQQAQRKGGEGGKIYRREAGCAEKGQSKTARLKNRRPLQIQSQKQRQRQESRRDTATVSRRCGAGALDLSSLWSRWGCRLLRRLYRRALLVFLRGGVFLRWRLACQCRGRCPCCAAGRPNRAKDGGVFAGLAKKQQSVRGGDTSKRDPRTNPSR